VLLACGGWGVGSGDPCILYLKQKTTCTTQGYWTLVAMGCGVAVVGR
jgi:hypothetical protein